MKTRMVTIRLAPELYKAAELAAAQQLRPVSNFVAWAVAQAVERPELAPDEPSIVARLREQVAELEQRLEDET